MILITLKPPHQRYSTGYNMTYTVNKKDMRQFLDIVFPKGWRGGHIFDVYTDLISVFEDGIEYDLENFLKSFVRDIPHWDPARKTYHLDEIVMFKDETKVAAGGKIVRYKEYLEPLFYVSLVMRHSKNKKVLGDVAGRICNDFPLFGLETMGWDNLWIEWYGEHYKDWRYRWLTQISTGKPAHHFTLTEDEHAETDTLYNIYLRAKMGMGGED